MLLGLTWPNRYYKWSAQSSGRKDNTPPLETLGNQWATIFDRAIGRGLSARYYHSDLPFSAVWGPRGVPCTRPLADYYADCALGMLPNVAIVDPPFRDGGGGDGLSADEHPHGDVRLGQAWMADVVSAFVQSSCYRHGALFVVYDEWGGFSTSRIPSTSRRARARSAAATCSPRRASRRTPGTSPSWRPSRTVSASQPAADASTSCSRSPTRSADQ